MKRWLYLIMVMVLLLCTMGCSEEEIVTETTEELPEGSIYLYYIDAASVELNSEPYALEGGGAESAHIKVNVANELDDQYMEVLTKQAITKTLCQLSYVEYVEFEVYDSSTTDNETVLEKYDEYSFVNAQAEGDFLQKGVITIYFANESGDHLLEYDKSVEITNNISLEQLVVESLITGPLRDGYGPTIPEGTTIKKISIKDGVCYVDLSGEFNGTMDNCIDVVTIYSVVNSLCELPTINKVQFLIDGEKQEFYREVIPMDGMFEFQEDLIEKEEEE